MSTAFVLAGGGSIGAVQVGMLRELLAHGVKPDLVVGSSVGAINGAYFAGDPSLEGVRRLEGIWRGLQLGGSAVYFSERYGYLTPGITDTEGNVLGRLGQQPGTLGANVWVGYENLGLTGLNLSAGCDNLLNTPVAYLQPYDAGHAPLPGTARSFYVRLSYAWRSDR